MNSVEEEQRWLMDELTKLIGNSRPHALRVLTTHFRAYAHRLLMEQAARANLALLNYLFSSKKLSLPKPDLYSGLHIGAGIPKEKFLEAFPDQVFDGIEFAQAEWLAERPGLLIPDDQYGLPASFYARRLMAVESYLNSSRDRDGTVEPLKDRFRYGDTDLHNSHYLLRRLTQLFDTPNSNAREVDSNSRFYKQYFDLDFALQQLIKEMGWTQADNELLKQQLSGIT